MTAPTRDLNSLWDIKAVAHRLGVQVRHIRRLVAERRIPYLKWGAESGDVVYDDHHINL